jgi:hypothetical protein
MKKEVTSISSFLSTLTVLIKVKTDKKVIFVGLTTLKIKGVSCVTY